MALVASCGFLVATYFWMTHSGSSLYSVSQLVRPTRMIMTTVLSVRLKPHPAGSSFPVAVFRSRHGLPVLPGGR